MRTTINVVELLKKEIYLPEHAVENGFELVKTKSCIKIQVMGKTVINLKSSDLIEYTIFQGFDFEIDDEDEDFYGYEEEHADEMKNYVVVSSGFTIFF